MSETSFTHRSPKTWEKFSITLPIEHSDTVATYLAELTNSAVEQSAFSAPESNQETDTVNVYLENNTELAFYKEQIQTFIDDLAAQHNFSCTLSTEKIVEQDWNKNWKKHFKPFKLTDRLVVKPSWEAYSPEQNEVVLEMDPGMAFGTGLHASTRLALQLTEELFHTSTVKSVLDVGTGTGILAMSCALFGAQKVIGIDNDIDARVAASDNIVQNHLQQKVAIIDDDLSQINTKFDLVIANITQDVLTLLAKDLISCINPGGSLILSGILTGEQSQNIKQTFTSAGLKKHASKQAEEWTALHFKAS